MLKRDNRRPNGNFSVQKDNQFKPDPDTRVKTELCRNWESGVCEYGEKCNFAHGLHELRDKYTVKNIKDRCEYFFKNGYCISGVKCSFSHNDESVSANRKKSPPIFIDLEMRTL